MELREPKEDIAANFTENRIGLVRNGAIIAACVIGLAIIVKVIFDIVKKIRNGNDVPDGYSRYDDSKSRTSQSRASTKRTNVLSGSADAPSVLSDTMSEL